MHWVYALTTTGFLLAGMISLAYLNPIVPWTIVFGSAIWGGIDCWLLRTRYTRFRDGPISTALGILILWIIVFPLYLARRFKLTLEDTGASAGDRAAASPDAERFKLTLEDTGAGVGVAFSECQICGSFLTRKQKLIGLCARCQARAR